ncbi:hypothetical protein GCM10010398_62260 [Streptomyces fimbriatus]
MAPSRRAAFLVAAVALCVTRPRQGRDGGVRGGLRHVRARGGGGPRAVGVRQGALVSPLNPEAILFDVAFLPQFVNPEPGMLRSSSG